MSEHRSTQIRNEDGHVFVPVTELNVTLLKCYTHRLLITLIIFLGKLRRISAKSCGRSRVDCLSVQTAPQVTTQGLNIKQLTEYSPSTYEFQDLTFWRRNYFFNFSTRCI